MKTSFGAFRIALAIVFLAHPAPAQTPAPVKPQKAPEKRKRAEEEAMKEERIEPEKEPPKPVVDGKPNYFVFAPLLGTWQTADGRLRLTIENGGAYTLSGAQTDSGALLARFGFVSRMPKNGGGQWIDGHYKFSTLSSFEAEDFFGNHRWNRVK